MYLNLTSNTNYTYESTSEIFDFGKNYEFSDYLLDYCLFFSMWPLAYYLAQIIGFCIFYAVIFTIYFFL